MHHIWDLVFAVLFADEVALELVVGLLCRLRAQGTEGRLFIVNVIQILDFQSSRLQCLWLNF